MSKYQLLWVHVQSIGTAQLQLTFEEVQEIAGVAIDHSFLNCKKELLAYGYQVGKISLKEKTVNFSKID